MDPDLRDLLLAWLNDDDPGEERREALLARLRADTAFRHAFVEEIRLLGMLKVVQSWEPRWLRLEDVCGWSRPEPASVAALADQVVRTAIQRRRRTLVRRALAVAAVFMVAVGAVFFFRAGTPSGRTRGSHMELATAIQLEEVDWDERGDLRPEEGSTVTAGRLCLRSGRVTLAFFSGVLLTVEGPTDLELAAMDRLFCHAGKLRLRVPAGAEGFTVQAPGYEVIDVGTEVGLNAATDETSYLRVFEGRAAVSLLDSRGRSVRSVLLGRGKEIAIDAKAPRIAASEPQPDRYVSLPHVLPPKLRLSPSYAAEVLAAKPWGYWRFERQVEGRVPNEIADRPGLEIREGVRLDGLPGGENHWAYFQPDNPRQALLMDGEWSPPRDSGYAIEAWVQAEALGESALISLIDRVEGAERPENHVSLLELTARSQRTPFEPCAVRFLDRWPPGQGGGVNVFSRHTFIPALWHHVVGQKTGAMLELYLDGRLAGSSPALPDSAEPGEVTRPCWLLVGRLKQWPPPTRLQVRPFEGRIDELALYERPLSLEEIRRHAKR